VRAECHTNLREYAYPHLYDLENAEFAPQGPFYQALAEQTGGPVLELGCGTGRLTIPLARAGFAITGLDIVPAMLERARQKAGGLPVRWVEADVRSFQLETQFRLIFATTGVVEHMLTRQDQEALLARVREHLAPDGLFALDDVEVSGTSRYDPATQINVETATRRWQGGDGQEHVHRAPLALRFSDAHEFTALLRACGFTVVAQYGDYDRGPLTPESTTLVTVCSAMTPR
jgi:SAM-dependent methyltransferase